MRTKIITSTESKQGGMHNHVKLGVFSKGTVLCGGCWLWAWLISGGLQTCIAESIKWLKHKLRAMLGGLV